MFELQSPETITVSRLRQISTQSRQIKEEYLQRIELHLMNRDRLNELIVNIDLLDSTVLAENALKISLGGAAINQQARLQREQERVRKRQEDQRKRRYLYTNRLTLLIGLYMIAQVALFSFFKTQFTSTGKEIQMTGTDIAVGVLRWGGVTLVALILYELFIKPYQQEN